MIEVSTKTAEFLQRSKRVQSYLDDAAHSANGERNEFRRDLLELIAFFALKQQSLTSMVAEMRDVAAEVERDLISTLAAAEDGVVLSCDGLTFGLSCEEPAFVDAADGRRLCLDCACLRKGELATPADLNAWHSAVLAVWASCDEN